MFIFLTVGHTRHSPIRKWIVVVISGLVKVIGSFVYNQEPLTNATNRVAKATSPHNNPKRDKPLALQHITNNKEEK